MTERGLRTSVVLVAGLLVMFAASGGMAEAPVGAATAFQQYAGKVEGRLSRQHETGSLAAMDAGRAARLRGGEVIVEQVSSAQDADLPGAMLHHWRGTAFVPGATAMAWERVMKDFAAYPRIYAPQVMQAKVLGQQGERFQVWMRVRQQHILTVVLDSSYDVSFGRRDVQHDWSVSRSTGVAEIAESGMAKEHELKGGEEHGFLWRLNTYWSCEERDGGLYVQIETVSLSRAIPRGLGWAVGPFVESVPRESVEFTLRRTVDAMRR